MTADPSHDELARFEDALARRDPAGIPGGLAALLAEDFVEIGRSGRVWSRGEMLALLAADPVVAPGALELEDLAVHPLADGVALVTYRAAGAHRSSIWVRRGGRWRLRYHQGTSVRDDRPGA